MFPSAPRQEPGVPTIEVNGPAAAGVISVGNERDMYTFNAATSGTYTIETAGNTDCSISLYPANPNTLIAQDDDSRPGANSRIMADLDSGEYSSGEALQPIRHGSLQIAVKS